MTEPLLRWIEQRDKLIELLYRIEMDHDGTLHILQFNTVEKTTLTHTVEKVLDFPEAVLSEVPFGGVIEYGSIPLYPVFTYLYRERLSSSSIAHGFLCFYRAIEGIRTFRKSRGAEGSSGRHEDEVANDDVAKHFPAEFHGKRFGYVIEKSFAPLRQKFAHAFVESKKFDLRNLDTFSSRIETEKDLSSNRTMAREMVRVMMHNEYWK